MAVVIRPARLADAAAIAELTAQLGYTVTETAATERLARILGRDAEAFFVAVADGAAIGWVHLVVTEYIETEPFVLIGGLVVAREQRRHGVGRALMEHAEAWARQRGCAFVRLSSTVTRVEAHRFYENLGYTTIKTQRSFIKPLSRVAAEQVRAFIPRVDAGADV